MELIWTGKGVIGQFASLLGKVLLTVILGIEITVAELAIMISERDLEWLAFRLGLDSTGATPSTRALLTILSEECADPPPNLKKRLDGLSGARARRQRQREVAEMLSIMPSLGARVGFGAQSGLAVHPSLG